ncbi:hypothetical protein FMM80_26405 [Schaedlerella arabinosiphila]|uniref:Uncharacterized protein n=1 Tax=Schaedlerella arabinosiphila TaxID=2044587 RepID=A0A9X5CCI2_9FIRM|nr:DUF6147 family protein [Schaedlerella arabinosiphila]KAI4441047.1 hypothetical protein C824_003546 [Schaedlerella arabinosiphila]NDO71987.1 hypothetical protein [Schaedlerella arabinosiphila]
MKRKLSMLSSAILLSSVILSVSLRVEAETVKHTENKVDGSYLTYEDYSYGTSSKSVLRGEHLMTGDSIITKTGNGRIYTYGETTANHDVDFVAVLVYVDRYDESDGLWGQIDARVKEDRDTYYVVSTKTLMVDRGYFYRVRCEHFAGNDDEEFYDDTVSFTDGIWIP